MAYWLMKSESGTYSWNDLLRDGRTEWDGVRNPAARLHLKSMKAGDEAFFYHSGDERAVVGIMRIAGEGSPDGADGGDGGDVVLVVRANTTSRSSRCGRLAR